jgi:hypothetical protein
VQLKIKNSKDQYTELRVALITGIQTGSVWSTEMPVVLLTDDNGFHQRKFNGAYFYWLQHLFSRQHQLVVKYNWYDPNTLVIKEEIGAPGSNFTTPDIKYSTIGVGYINYLSDNLKLMLYYAMV